jgi:hypothetical protein
MDYPRPITIEQPSLVKTRSGNVCIAIPTDDGVKVYLCHQGGGVYTVTPMDCWQIHPLEEGNILVIRARSAIADK